MKHYIRRLHLNQNRNNNIDHGVDVHLDDDPRDLLQDLLSLPRFALLGFRRLRPNALGVPGGVSRLRVGLLQPRGIQVPHGTSSQEARSNPHLHRSSLVRLDVQRGLQVGIADG